MIEHVTQSPIRPLAPDRRSGRDGRNPREAESSVAWALRLDGRRCHARGSRARPTTVLILEDLIEQIHRSRWNRITRSQTSTGNVKGLVTAGQSKLANEEFKIGTVAPHERGDIIRLRPLGCVHRKMPSQTATFAPPSAPTGECKPPPPSHTFTVRRSPSDTVTLGLQRWSWRLGRIGV